ncbi:LamG-like jellyroll fold domain-containing protein [Micromonospora sp. NPDC050200]|uniref:LamG-like jellyroll fold domain-containing protein n=1 Tax=Micromonospora sp. NPDC050200 TaxID=3155664 RepID=UPI0033F95DE7
MPRLLPAFLTVLLASALTGSPAVASGTATSPSPVGAEQVLFRSGTGGYGCFRIPALVRTGSGALLAFAEGRKSPSCSDRGDIDIVMRRSTNDGRTWGPIQVVLAGSPSDSSAPAVRGNPAPVVDETTGRVLLVSTSGNQTPTGRRLPWVQHSDDEGRTWSAARPLDVNFAGTPDGWFATGPSHGVQLRGGPHSGRLVVGAHQITGGKAYPGVLYSDDGGGTWSASAVLSPTALSVGEISVAELPGGAVYAAARNDADESNHRAYAISTDGGTTMPAFTALPSLVSPDVQGAVLAPRAFYQSTPGDTLLYTGPASPTDRQVMQVRYSVDGGRTWARAPGGQLTDQRAGYSDLAEMGGGEIGVLYEGGTTFSADELRFNRFSPAALGIPGTFTGSVSAQQSTPPGRTTPDTSAQANDAYLTGDATVAAQSLVLDGAGDYAEVPYARSLDPGAADFTMSLRFKHAATAATPQRALLWAYGTGAGVPQVWVRLQPAQDQAYAWVQGTQGGAAVALKDGSAAAAFGDDAWHQLTLTRSGGQITLTVDGTLTASATGIAGPVAGAAPSGIRLGAKQDGTASDAFAGSLADVRLPGVVLPFAIVDTAVTPARVRVTLSDDVSGHCTAATLLGGWRTVTTGLNGTAALTVDATHPGAESPYTPALDVGGGDFTYATWFRYTGTANQALIWAYGATSGKRALWVRAQPGQDRVYAWVQTDKATVSIPVPDTSAAAGFGDGAWHLLTVRRSGDQVRVGVDGASAVASGLTGSLTANPADGLLGLRLGSKPGGTDIMQGAVDELRLYRRALSDAELTSAVAAKYPADLPSVWWSFDGNFTTYHDVVRPAPDGPATPDHSARCKHAYVRGGATLTAGRYGSALAFDGVDDAVQLAHGAPLALGDRDFTVATWLRYSAASGRDQVVFWAYGVGATERALWLRAQPGKDRLMAYAQTDVGPAGVAALDASASVAFGDNAWHHVALTRAAGVLSLSVDGKVLSSAPISGSLTYGDTFEVDGLQLGARLDGVDRLAGALDEVRVFDRALSDEELARVRDNADLGSPTVLRLPFEVVSATGYPRM